MIYEFCILWNKETFKDILERKKPQSDFTVYSGALYETLRILSISKNCSSSKQSL